MPAHFTHIYTARRISDHLLSGQFPDWPAEGSPILRFDPVKCGQVMRTWEKFTAIGAIGPDLFYFSQDYNGEPLGPLTDEIMLALAVYYYFDAAKEDDWEPLLIILQGVSSTAAAILRFLIKLQKIWNDFVAGWNATIGPFVSQAEGLLDALTGGLLSEFGTVVDELKTALKTIAEEELLTYKDIFTMFDTCVQKGFQEKLFLWSDMSHYRKPSALCQGLVAQVDELVTEAARLRDAGQREAADAMAQKADQFLAFTLGYITHLGIDTVGHSFVNEQCGGPFRNHPQRHHLIENHIDAWNYMQTKPGGRNAPDPWGYSDDYPDVSMSALWFAVQITDDPSDPTGQGSQRPSPLPTDPTAQKAALDVDGHMPDWMAECIVKAMIATFNDDEHPLIYQGSKFQSQIDAGFLSQVIESVTGSGSNAPFPELLQGIAPKPSFDVPVGFPLPWQIKVTYMVMISFYKFSYTGSWELEKPRKPDFIIFPPSSDFSNLFQPPDLSGVDSSNPVTDVCALFVALFDWAIKVLEAAGQLIEDLIKMAASPGSYLFRLGLYQLAMMIWDVITKTHEIMAHTGFLMPHGEQTYADNGELRLPDEIDVPLITLGGTVDAAFTAALAAAFDPLGNLDQTQSVIGTSHPIPDGNYPFYPVLQYDQPTSTSTFEPYEFTRPWAYPTTSVVGAAKTQIATPTEAYNPQATYGTGGGLFGNIPTNYKPLRAGPYPVGTMPDVLFRLDAPVDSATRLAYEQAQTPWDTDQLNEQHIGDARKLGLSPLGDAIPFSAHLIGQLVNDTGYSTQFNLDSDRAFAYLTWDWLRDKGTPQTGILGLQYVSPNVPPEGAPGWGGPRNAAPLELKYVSPPILPPPPPLK